MRISNVVRTLLLSAVVLVVGSSTLLAQGLNWEGQTGALLTPFAYTASSPAAKFGKPEVALHYLNSGSVVGNDYQLSITEGVAKYFEFGFTQSFSSAGNDANLSPLFSNGYSTLHGKLNLLPENLGHRAWLPAIALGATGRFDIQRVGSYDLGGGRSAHNGDFYIVATKTVTQIKGLPLVLNFGEKVTNAQLFGVAGNAPHFQGRLFGAAAFVVKGPAGSLLIFGSEAVQQPHHIEGLPTVATVPTSESYFVRVQPKLQALQVDFGVAHLAGRIVHLPGSVVDVKAVAQVGAGVSYHF